MKKFLIFLWLIFPVGAYAHAFPISYSPDGFSLNPTMPSAVMIRLSQGISEIGNSIEVFAPDGTKLSPVSAMVDGDDAHVLLGSIASGKGDGIYVVSWHVVSLEDGHFTKGAFSFFVGGTSSAPDFYGGSTKAKVGAPRDTYKETLSIFFLFLSLSILIGSCAFSLFLRREKTLNDHTRAQFISTTRRFVYFALFVLFVGVVAFVFFRMQFPFAKPSGALATASFLFGSIAPLSVFVWVGSILAFALAYLPLLASESALLSLRAPLRLILGRIFAWSLLAFGVSGAWSVWVHLKSLENLTTTLWGSAFITLLLFVGCMFKLHFLSLSVLERMKRCIHCEWAYALLESGVGLCVLFCIALMSVTPSPVYNSNLWSVTRMDASRMITVADLGGGEGALRLLAYDAKGVPISTSLPTVLFDNAKEGIGPLVIPVKDRGEGNYDIPEVLLTPRGEWRIAITFKQQSAYDINATIGIDYPHDIDSARDYARTSRFGIFELLLSGVAFVMLALSFVMLYFVRRNNAFALLHPEYDTDPTSIGARKAIIIAIIAFLSVITVVAMLRMLLPFYSEEIHDGKIAPMHTEIMPQGMSGMQM